MTMSWLPFAISSDLIFWWSLWTSTTWSSFGRGTSWATNTLNYCCTSSRDFFSFLCQDVLYPWGCGNRENFRRLGLIQLPLFSVLCICHPIYQVFQNWSAFCQDTPVWHHHHFSCQWLYQQHFLVHWRVKVLHIVQLNWLWYECFALTFTPNEPQKFIFVHSRHWHSPDVKVNFELRTSVIVAFGYIVSVGWVFRAPIFMGRASLNMPGSPMRIIPLNLNGGLMSFFGAHIGLFCFLLFWFGVALS